MGYSYAAKAGNALDALENILNGGEGHRREVGSNGYINNPGWFWEHGKEQADGSITGTVYKPWAADPTRVVKAGSFKITAEGKILRFPGTTQAQRETAEKLGLTKFDETYIRNL